jgi:regulatory protein
MEPSKTSDSASTLGAESVFIETDPYSQGMSIALRKLNAHPRTRHEISVVLAGKGFDDNVSSRILDRLTELGYINDQEFAHSWVRSRFKSKGLAPAVLRRELIVKGVDPEYIDSAFAGIEQADTVSRARELAEKKLRSLSGVSESVAVRRISSLLQRKGYPSGVAYAVAREVVGHNDT